MIPSKVVCNFGTSDREVVALTQPFSSMAVFRFLRLAEKFLGNSVFRKEKDRTKAFFNKAGLLSEGKLKDQKYLLI